MTNEQTGPGSWGEPRQKTITWYDPVTSARALLELTGREALEAIRDGRAAPPPISAHFDFAVIEIGDGTVTFECTPDSSSYNPIGTVHGGLVCTLLDSVVGCAVHSTLPARVGYTSIELKVNYLRAVHGDAGLLTATGRVIKPGRRVAFAEGELRDEQGRLVATASGSCLIMPLD